MTNRRERRRPRPRRVRVERALFAGALTLVAGLIAATAWLLLVFPDRPGGGDGRALRMELAEGADIEAVAGELGRQGMLQDPWKWVVYMRLQGADERLRVGTVWVHDAMTPAQISRRVASGFGRAIVQVVVPEGFTRFDIARRLEQRGVCTVDAFLHATVDRGLLTHHGIDQPTFEGYLFPDTYELREHMQARSVVSRMTNTFRRKVMPLLDEHAASLAELRVDLGFELHQVLTLASLVEKEAAVASERPLIAGVFLNRMRSPDFPWRRLQCDPTVSYGCLAFPQVSPACRAYTGGAITQAMLDDRRNPYNTYRIRNLPPGPIANPGLAAIRAVLVPARHNYLYFVARGQGRHKFSETLAQHNEARQRHAPGDG